jgi:hypothetical protein
LMVAYRKPTSDYITQQPDKEYFFERAIPNFFHSIF